MTPRIRTDRLLMREWREDDLAPFAALNADPRVTEHFASPLSPAESDDLVEHIRTCWRERGYGLWALERTDTGVFVGYAGLWPAEFEAPFTPAVEVGWRLAAGHWGHGFATEAGAEALRYGFETAGTHGDRLVHRGRQRSLAPGDGAPRHAVATRTATSLIPRCRPATPPARTCSTGCVPGTAANDRSVASSEHGVGENRCVVAFDRGGRHDPVALASPGPRAQRLAGVDHAGEPGGEARDASRVAGEQVVDQGLADHTVRAEPVQDGPAEPRRPRRTRGRCATGCGRRRAGTTAPAAAASAWSRRGRDPSRARRPWPTGRAHRRSRRRRARRCSTWW